jgi:heme A synthase
MPVDQTLEMDEASSAGLGTVKSGRGRLAYRIVVLAALAAAIGQVALGGVVRVTGSGLGCPDWPLCHGSIVPPFQLETLIEYSHRLSASVLSILVVAATVLAWRVLLENRTAIFSMAAALGLVAVAAVLGGVTVLTELAWWVVMVHLALAKALVASLVIASTAERNTGSQERSVDVGAARNQQFERLLTVTLVGAFALILTGSYMVGLGYGSACATWPLCNGDILPRGEAYLVHMAHRYVAGLVGLLIAGVALTAWYRRIGPNVGKVALALVGLLLIQTLLGAATVWTGFSPALKSVHLVAATLVWAALIYLAALQFAVRHSEPEGRSP